MNRSPSVRANSVQLKRQEHGGSFLVVEGRDDRLFFEKFVDREYCWVIVADGKQNVAEVVGILRPMASQVWRASLMLTRIIWKASDQQVTTLYCLKR